MSRHAAITPDQARAARRRYEAGETREGLAAELGVPLTTLDAAWRRLGLRRQEEKGRRPIWTDARCREARDLWLSGLRWQDVADRMGTTKQAARRAVERWLDLDRFEIARREVKARRRGAA